MTPNYGKWELWGSLRDRYETRHRAGGPYRMLALDGGGIRGLITLAILVRLEEKLGEALERKDFRLCDFFECIGGTSTGAIIATGLARGMSAKELLRFYKDFGREVFVKRSVFSRWKSLYGNGPLQKKLQEFFQDPQNLEPQNLKSVLVVVTRNATTDSAWPISSNPWAKYNCPTRPDCNLQVPQWKLVRASTAAPVYFSPEVIEWSRGDDSKSFVFVDGGTTAYNCPAFVMARMASEPAYGLCWPRGEDKMLVVSIGTGSAPMLGTTADDPESNLLAGAVNTLSAVMNQAQIDQDMNCRTVGRCSFGPLLDREVLDLVPREDGKPIPLTRDLGRAFLYARYDAELTAEGLGALGLGHLDPAAAAKLDSVDSMADLVRIGERVAEKIDLAHFGAFVRE
jgi:uncharacterized protein